MDLTTATTPVRAGDDRFLAEIPPGWLQGRGAFGGITLANLARALEAYEGAPERRLRSLTAEIAGPVVAGPAEIRVERLRAGSGVSTLAARLLQGGEVLAHAVGVFGKSRVADTDLCELVWPAPPPFREVPRLPRLEGLSPEFAENFDLRSVGPAPFGGGPSARTSGWVRPMDPGPARDAGYVVALADAWWPAIFSRLTAPRPMGTIAFTLEILSSCEGLALDAPLFHSGHTIAARDGYTVELRELWGEDGRLLALNQQTIAVIR